jgi:hypothetical protein
MRFLENESGATRTENGLIAAGVGFAVTLAVLPPGITLARPIAALVLLVAWGAAALWLD